MSIPPVRFDLPRGVTYGAGARRAAQRLAQSINANVTDSDLGASGSGSAIKVYRSANQTISTGGYYDISWDAESIDAGGWHSTTTNPERITVPLAGLYMVTFMATWTIAAVTTPGYKVLRNGGNAYIMENTSLASGGDGQTHSIVDVAAAGDYYTLQVYHNSGVSRDIQGGETSTWICVQLIGGV